METREYISDRKKTEAEKWVKTWHRADLALRSLKKDELRSPDYYEKNRDILDGMLQYACDNDKPKILSGLVEQQRMFMQLRDVIRK